MKATEVTRFEHSHNPDIRHFVRSAAEKSGCIVLRRGYEDSVILAPTLEHMQQYIAQFPAGQQIKKLPKLMSGLFFYTHYTDDDAIDAEDRGSTRILKAETKRNRDRAHDPKLHSGVEIVFHGDYEAQRDLYRGSIPGYGTVMCGKHDDRTDYNYTEFNREYLETMCKRIPFDVAVKLIPSFLAGNRLDEEPENNVQAVEETTIGVPLS